MPGLTWAGMPCPAWIRRTATAGRLLADPSPLAAPGVNPAQAPDMRVTRQASAPGREAEPGPLDSVHLPEGSVRRVGNRSARPATLPVIIGPHQQAG